MTIRQDKGRAILTAAQMRDAEQIAFAAGDATADALMELAGLEVARTVRRVAGERPVLVIAGPGNNGGDAYVAARWLAAWSFAVEVVPVGAPKPGAAAHAAARWTGRSCSAADARRPYGGYVLVDGLFGTGARRPGRPPELDHNLFSCAARTIAIDVPSWIDPDTGAIEGWGRDLPGDITVALGALKPAHVLAGDRCGHLLFVDFGWGVSDRHGGWLVEAQNRAGGGLRRVVERPSVPRPRPTDHKYRGKVTVVSGAMPGAARLAARGAVGVGSGYVVLSGDPSAAGPLDAIVHRPRAELGATLADERATVLLGPGLGRDDVARALLDEALASPCRLILDGDALTLLGTQAAGRLRSRNEAAGGHTVLTPHEGEFARMFGESGANKLDRTAAASRASGATIVHKGRCTVIASPPDGDLRVCVDGSTWLATAGTGDVLAGAVAGRWASGSDAGYAETAVGLHARASVLAGAAFSADRLAEFLPVAVAVAERERPWR